MSKLIQQLIEEHRTIEKQLQEVRKHGLAKKEGRDALAAAKRTLLDHLKREDEQLHPELERAAKTNKDLDALLRAFSTDMKNVSTAALALFEKFEKNTASALELSRDFGTLSARLAMRIGSEESLLYPEYTKLARARGT